MNAIDIFNLEDNEKVVLVEKLWDSIHPENIELLEAVKLELDNRLERFKDGKIRFFTTEDLKNRLKSLR